MELCRFGIQFKAFHYCKGEDHCDFHLTFSDLIYDIVGPGHMGTCRWKREADCSDCHLYGSFTCKNKTGNPDTCRVFKVKEFEHEVPCLR